MPASKRTPGPSGAASEQHAAGRRQVVRGRVLRVEAALERVPARDDVLLRDRERPAGRDLDLQPHEVEAR